MRKRSMVCAALVLSGLLSACGAAQQDAGSGAEVIAAQETVESEGTAAQEAKQTGAATEQDAAGAEQQTEAGAEASEAPVTLMVAAAASLEYAFREELIPAYEAAHPHVTIEGTYDSSGKLQTQIESGLEADIFMSAAMKQMNALLEQGAFIDEAHMTPLLENKIVLIVPAEAETQLQSFEGIAQAETIALGDPASVPVGQYAQEALTSLGIYEEIQPKLSLGTNVTEVLNWVAEGSADCGIVYATDAATTDKVRVIAEAPAGSLKSPVLYPLGMLQQAEPAALDFYEYLCSEEALKVFEAYGFSAYQPAA